MIEKAKIEKITVCKMTGAELRRLRIAAGLEQKELAGKVDLTRARIAYLEYRTEFTLTPEQANRLLSALGVSSI